MRLTVNRNFPVHFFFVVLLLELFLGGGGRLIDTGSLSIRMCLFICALLLSVFILFKKRAFDKNILWLILASTVTLFLGVLLGVLNRHDFSDILTDIKPLIYFYSIVYFYLLINTLNDIERIAKLLKVSSLILGAAYLVAFVLINLKKIPFNDFYNWASSTEEFFFRGEFAFFYKGFLYMCIGLFFFNWRSGLFSKLSMIILLLAVLLTFTRGFILCLFLVYIFNLLFIKRKLRTFLVIGIVSFLSASTIWTYVSSSDKLDRVTSNSNRVIQIQEVFRDVTSTSLFFGNGFGANISSREDLHLEISYLEIFYKQGLIGLTFWTLFFLLIIDSYRTAALFNEEKSNPFLLASLFTFLLSFTNPFINNPIGLTILIISLVSLKRIGSLATPEFVYLNESK